MSHIKISNSSNIAPQGADKIPIARAGSSVAYHVTVSDLRNNIKNVKDYGATGDGVSDDTTAVQAALTATGRVYFPDGIYLCTRLTVPSNTEVFGSQYATIKAKALNDKSLIRNANPDTGNTNIHIHDLKLDGNRSAQTATTNPCHAIAFYYVTNSSVRNCTITNTEQDGVYLGVRGTVESVTVGGDNTRIDIFDNLFDTCYRNGISITRGSYVKVARNTFIHCNAGYPTATYDAATIDLEPNDTLDSCHHIQIKDNMLYDCVDRGIQLAGSASSSYSDIDISNNQINITGVLRGAIDVTATTVDRLKIMGNTIDGVPIRGITLTTVDGAIIIGNQITSTSSEYGIRGILVNDTCTKIMIANNYIFGWDTSIQTGSSGADNLDILVIGNICRDTASTGVVSFRQTADWQMVGNQLADTGYGAGSIDFYDYNRTVIDSLGVGNSAVGTTLGTVTKKIEVFDAQGASLGFIAVYDAIT